ncbi:MAG: hypothetical protein LAO56_21365 [Acidobacteriia bacterium]|nr:hypothetical protein [Terriglobia bacterium]
MKDRGQMEPIVERVVAQAIDSHAAQLRSEIVRRVMDELEAGLATTGSTSDMGTDLARAVAEIQLGTSQREILAALLDTCARYAARVALFVVKSGHASGWQGRGFVQNDRLKDFSLDATAPAVGRAIQDRVIVNAPSAEVDSHFLEEFGTPASGATRFLPLVLKDKVAALVYADGGTDAAGKLDAGALELLVLSTSAWLEVNSLRKQAHKEPAAEPVESRPAAAPQASPAYNDPFASHAPGHAWAAVATAEASAPAAAAVPPTAFEAQHAVTETPPAVVETEAAPADLYPLPMAQSEPVAATEPTTPAASDVSPEDQEVHRKAHRFARLLVDEIKLYNQAQVSEGRKNKDLYDRLKEAVEKSRTTYQKRYGNTVAASANYFQDEVVRSLAEDDISIMGANFRR